MPETMNILAVEDNEGDIEMIERAVRANDRVRLSVANNGGEALDFLLKRDGFADAPTPNLIFVDLNMPQMDGKRFLEAVKQEPALKAIPVIVLTSSQSPSDIRDCYERQASCYVVKPFDGREFIQTVQQIVVFWSGVAQFA
jgi:two-component system, chemotaxis family, response regulator Rcp1